MEVTVYGFADVLEGGFGGSIQYAPGIYAWLRLWGEDYADTPSNWKKLGNLTKLVEEEAAA